MKILTDIIKHACSRFNIDSKDLCDDPESCAHSKSSSRAPDEGDENWLACLGHSKRCDNGQAYLVKTYKGRVETEEIMEYLSRLLHGYFHKQRPEQNISLRESRFGGTSTTTMVNSQVLMTGNSSQPTSISAGSYLRRTYRSPAFHTAVYALNGGGKNRLDISRLVHVNTFTPRQRSLLSTLSQRRCANTPSKSNAKRGRPPKRKRALEYQPGEMPSPEKVSKEARVEENDDEDIFKDAFEECL